MSKITEKGMVKMVCKRIFISLIAVILFSLTFVSFALASDYKSEVRVGLKYNSADAVSMSSRGGMNVYNAVTGEVLFYEAAGTELLIKGVGAGFCSDGKFYADSASKISVQPQNNETIFCNGVEYRGYIFLEMMQDGTIVLVNILGTDDYVASVLGKEMSYSWPKEALKAQAVCARNFVLCRTSHKNHGFDVCATTHCQVYGGIKSEHENTRQAVNETKRILAKYNGEVVPLYFFATSGGATEDVKNVWGSSVGYLKSVQDTYENPEKASKYRWSVSLTRAEIEEKLRNAGATIGNLRSIKVDSVTNTGRVLSLTFSGDAGSYTAKLEKCRTILGVYSQRFSVFGEASAPVVTTAGNITGGYRAIDSSQTVQAAGARAIMGNGVIAGISADNQGSENYRIEGGGYGHGVGMSQWGARAMAENGFTYDSILKHYFTDIVLE